MDTGDVELVRKVPKLLTSIAAYSDEHYKRVLEAFDSKGKKPHDKHRFHQLVKCISTLHDSRGLVNFLTFVNALISLPKNVEQRTQIREEFIEEGILSILQVT